MRTRLAILALVLLGLTLAAPGIEAIAGCIEPCPDEAPGARTCADDVCCSCCVHAGPLFASLPLPAPPVDRAGTAVPCETPTVPTAQPSGVLHVPKLSAA